MNLLRSSVMVALLLTLAPTASAGQPLTWQLNERDRFTVYAFDDTIETPPEAHGPGLIPASDRNRLKAAA